MHIYSLLIHGGIPYTNMTFQERLIEPGPAASQSAWAKGAILGQLFEVGVSEGH